MKFGRIMRKTIKGTLAGGAIALAAEGVSPVLAQCPPTQAGVKCWDGGGPNNNWSEGDNWAGYGADDNQAPEAGDMVYHLTDRTTIEFDDGDLTIAGYRFGPTLNGALKIKAGNALRIRDGNDTGSLRPTSGTVSTYNLTVEPDATLAVDEKIIGLDEVVIGTVGDEDAAIVGLYEAGAPNHPDVEFAMNSLSLLGNNLLTVSAYNASGTLNVKNYLEVDTEDGSQPANKWGIITDCAQDSIMTLDNGSRFQSGSHDTESIELKLWNVYFGQAGDGDDSPSECLLSGLGDVNHIAAWESITFGSAGEGDAVLAPSGQGGGLLIEIPRGDLMIYSEIHDEAAAWDASNVDLIMCTRAEYTLQSKHIEMISPDISGTVLFTDSPCIKPWKSFQFHINGDCGECGVSGSQCCLVTTDGVDNINQTLQAELGGGVSEVMYVLGDVTIDDFEGEEDDPTVSGGHTIYYVKDYNGPSQYDGDPFVQVVGTLYGDFDGDCPPSIWGSSSCESNNDTQDVNTFNAAFPSDIEDGNYSAIVDWNCDLVIDCVDRAKFFANWPNSTSVDNNSCP